ncbi:hypothetical protein Hanom_Chr05g00442881 [Helianthus anomalus]
MDWIRSCKIGFVVQENPIIYNTHIGEFWTSAKVSTINKDKTNSMTIRNKPVYITEARVRSVLKLQVKLSDPMRMKKEDIFDSFKIMKYDGDFKSRNEIKKKG